jgi:virginiamycin A acetyltransferase
MNILILNIKLKFLQIIKNIINKVSKLNNIDKGTKIKIEKWNKIEGCSFSGNIIIHGDSEIINSEFKGNIDIADNSKIINSKLNGNIKAGIKFKLLGGVNLIGNINIGNYTSISGPNTDLTSLVNEIKIGNFCSIARNVTFQEFNHKYDALSTYFMNHNLLNENKMDDIVSKGSIEIENDVWIGTHCVILSGSKIGTGAVIAANSVVSGKIPAYALAAGTPARVIKYRFNDITIKFLLESKWWEKNKEDIIKFKSEFKEKC